jgi:hypothetical protein
MIFILSVQRSSLEVIKYPELQRPLSSSLTSNLFIRAQLFLYRFYCHQSQGNKQANQKKASSAVWHIIIHTFLYHTVF